MEQALFQRTTGSTAPQISETAQFPALDSTSCRQRQRGFALIAALIATIIMLGLGILVIQLSTQDLRSGAATVGEKKALTAADTGIHKLLPAFYYPTATGNLDEFAATDVVVDATNAPGDQYSISVPDDTPTPGPTSLHVPGFSTDWGLKRFDVDVTGRNTNHGTEVQIRIGMGYFGPAEGGYK
jgi:hypothetical protein